jgi:hypothetical protein
MPVTTSILTKKHYLIITLVLIVAGCLGLSPTLSREFQNHPKLTAGPQEIENIPDEVAQATEALATEELVTENTATEDPAIENLATPIISNQDETYKYTLPVIFRGFYFGPQVNTPVYLPNFTHADSGCSWLGVAGQVFGENDIPINGMTVSLSGMINGRTISLNGVTGEAQAYGQGGYEIKIANAPFSSSGSLIMILIDGNQTIVANPVPLVTFEDCSKNLILVNYSLIKY